MHHPAEATPVVGPLPAHVMEPLHAGTEITCRAAALPERLTPAAR